MDILSQIKLLFGPLVIQLVWYLPNLFSISLSSPKFWKILLFSFHSLLVKISRRLSNRHGWVGRGYYSVRVGHGSGVESRGSWARDPPCVYTSCIHIFMLFQMPTPNSAIV